MADETKRRGRPRSEHARLAVLAAAAELLLDFGLDAVSMDQIAEQVCRPEIESARSAVKRLAAEGLVEVRHIIRTRKSPARGVPDAKTHLRARLALDPHTRADVTITAVRDDTGTLRGDLISLIRPWVRRLESRPYAGVIASLITEAHSNPAFAREWRERFVAVRRDPALRLLQRAIERGEIPRNTDVDLVLDLIYGPLYHRLFHGHAPLNERVAVKVVDAALAGILAPAPR